MADRQNYGEGSRFEDLGGYSRAVRSGALVAVAGTAPIDGGETVHPATFTSRRSSRSARQSRRRRRSARASRM